MANCKLATSGRRLYTRSKLSAGTSSTSVSAISSFNITIVSVGKPQIWFNNIRDKLNPLSTFVWTISPSFSFTRTESTSALVATPVVYINSTSCTNFVNVSTYLSANFFRFTKETICQ